MKESTPLQTTKGYIKIQGECRIRRIPLNIQSKRFQEECHQCGKIHVHRGTGEMGLRGTQIQVLKAGLGGDYSGDDLYIITCLGMTLFLLQTLITELTLISIVTNTLAVDLEGNVCIRRHIRDDGRVDRKRSPNTWR